MMNLKIVVFLLVLISSSKLEAGDWIQKTAFGGVGRHRAVGCGTDFRGYLGLGHVNGTGIDISYKDWWEYDPGSDSWTQKANYPVNNHGAVAFVVNNMPCVGGGSALAGEFYKYNPQLNIWTAIASCPYFNPGDTQGFSVNNKGYVYLANQLAEYDPVANLWNLMPQAPFNFSTWSCAFSVGSSGYIKTGNKLVEFKPSQQIWLPRADFPGESTGGSNAFSIHDQGYITCGYVGGLSVVTDEVWAYNPGTNQWYAIEDFKGTSRRFPVAFAVDNRGYFGTGTNGINMNDFWQYNPSINSNLDIEQAKIHFYPNPTSEYIQIEIKDKSLISDIQIINSSGQIIFNKKLVDESEQINVSKLPNGIYQFHVYNGDLLIFSDKMIIQK